MKTLSDKRRQLLRKIASHEAVGHFPTTRELADEMGLAGVTSLNDMLEGLAEQGFLSKQGGGKPRLPRIFRLTEMGRREIPDAADYKLLPHIGRIAAGLLREAIQECSEFVHVGDALHIAENDFLLTITGDSMIGDGILDGDMVQIRPGVQINFNEIAAVQIDRGDGIFESTLKRVRFQEGQKKVTLRASNQAYEDMILPAKNVEFIGAYRGLLRRLN